MGRAGTGGGHSGGHSSGGGHSHSRSSGGHRVGSSSSGRRAGTSYSSHSFSSSHHGSYHPSHHYGGGYYGGGRHSSSLVSVLVSLAILLGILFSFIGSMESSSSVKSTIVREKLNSGNSYVNDCIIDDLDWFDNVNKTESKLKEFYNKTGVQPFIYLKAYDSSLTTDSEKEEWARDYYESEIDIENGFLYVYFAEPNIDDIGYMCYVNGYETSSVMDSEAVEIFWNYIDRYWTNPDISTDDLFYTVFTKTGDTIMKVSTTNKDIVKYIIIAVIVIVIAITGVTIVSKKIKREKEKAEETERILNTPISELGNCSDDLESKYR